MLVDSLPKDSAHRPFTYSELPRNLTIAETLFPQLENSLPVEKFLRAANRQIRPSSVGNATRWPPQAVHLVRGESAAICGVRGFQGLKQPDRPESGSSSFQEQLPKDSKILWSECCEYPYEEPSHKQERQHENNHVAPSLRKEHITEE